jgi:RNA polymerase sigma factor (sigma-70 family)
MQQSARIVSIDSGGHRQRVLARRDALVEAHLWLVPPIAARIKHQLPPCFDLADLEASGYLGLIHVATRYRPCVHGHAPFAAYARPRIRGAILDSIRRRNYAEATRPPLPARDPGIPDDLDRLIDEERLGKSLAEALTWLQPRQRDVIRRFYAEGATVETIGAALGLKRWRVDRDRADAIAELRRRLEWAGAA